MNKTGMTLSLSCVPAMLLKMIKCVPCLLYCIRLYGYCQDIPDKEYLVDCFLVVTLDFTVLTTVSVCPLNEYFTLFGRIADTSFVTDTVLAG